MHSLFSFINLSFSEGMKAILQLKEKFPTTIVAGFGLHPRYFDEFTDENIFQAIEYIRYNLQLLIHHMNIHSLAKTKMIVQ